MKTVHRGKRFVSVTAFTVVVVLLLCSPSWADAPPSRERAAKGTLPRMIDVGRSQCTPCKMMAPVLEELKREYAGVIEIEFIDFGKNPDAMKKVVGPVTVWAIPFQVFYDASGKLVKEHNGYMSKKEIVRAFRELGFDSAMTKAQGK